jgi:hypothetical protein
MASGSDDEWVPGEQFGSHAGQLAAQDPSQAAESEHILNVLSSMQAHAALILSPSFMKHFSVVMASG